MADLETSVLLISKLKVLNNELVDIIIDQIVPARVTNDQRSSNTVHRDENLLNLSSDTVIEVEKVDERDKNQGTADKVICHLLKENSSLKNENDLLRKLENERLERIKLMIFKISVLESRCAEAKTEILENNNDSCKQILQTFAENKNKCNVSQKVDWANYVAQAETKLSKVSVTDTHIGEPDEDASEKFGPSEASLLAKIIRKGLVENKNDIEVQRRDPKPPLYSVKTFEALNLKPSLLKGVYEMGFKTPSKIQATALPTLLADPCQNLIAQSQSGTGKTAAFVLAMLSRVDPSKHYPQVLCLAPTYELAIETGEAAAHMAKFCPEIEMRFAVRGEELPRGTKLTEHIIIGTPGKVLDWSLKFKVFDLKKISVFVLDEADVMIDQQGHQDQWIRIHKELSSSCQMMFFSTTYTEDVMNFAEHIVKSPIIIRLKREEEILDNIAQYCVRCSTPDEKYSAVTNIYGTLGVGQALIFCQTRKTAAWLSEEMSKDGHAVAVLSGDLTVEQRMNVLDRFREEKEKVLITTNVLPRGIDVKQVTIVVNFELPVDFQGEADCKTYLHRIGRTGRFGKKGIVINLVESKSAMRICKDIEKHFGKKIHYLNAEDCDEIEKIGQ